jgi:outer membrane immunogenic protein
LGITSAQAIHFLFFRTNVVCEIGAFMARKSAFLTSTALTTSMAFVSGAAVAADLRMPVKAAPPVAPPFSWTGCYIGANAGVAWANIDQAINVPGVIAIDSSGRDSGFIGGGQAGCNWQYSSNWVFGVEGDTNFLDLKRNRNFAFAVRSEDVTGSQATKLRWLTTVRGRLGYAWDRSLAYVTGGLAAGNVKSSVSALWIQGPGVYSGAASDTRWGWTIGAGYEYAFTGAISAKLEYLHFDLSNVSYPVPLVSGPTFLPATWFANAKVSGDLFRVGINVRLNP